LNELLGLMPIRWMVDAVIGRNVRNGKRIYPLKAANVVAILLGVGAALVMSVDAAIAAEVVFGGVRVELIEPQVLGALNDADAAQWHRGNDGALAPANGTIAAPGVNDAVWEIQFQFHRPAMACGSVLGLNRYSTNFLEHY